MTPPDNALYWYFMTLVWLPLAAIVFLSPYLAYEGRSPMTDPRTAIGEARRIAALWAGLLLAPAVFLANLELGYALVPSACRINSARPVHAVHFTGGLGRALGLLFTLVILSRWIPGFVLSPCQ